MTISIRKKLFISISGLILFFVLMSLGLTRVGLGTFYIWQKKNALLASSQAIDTLYHGRPEDISLELEQWENTLGAGIIIITQEGYVKYSSFGRIINQKMHEAFPPPPHDQREPSGNNSARVPPPPVVMLSRDSVDSRTILERQQDQKQKLEFMYLERRLKNGDTLIIRQPLAPMSESAAAAAQFMVFTGLLSIIVGCTWAFFFAKKFTYPILELNRLALRISRLDFSQKWTMNHSDEIGELGKSINHLSEQLDTAISELNLKNKKLLADVERERQVDKMRKEFVSSVSHELKTPLALILGYAEGLKENVARDEASKNYYASVIVDEAGKMDKLVKDLLNLSQIESGIFQLDRTDFDLSLLLNDIAQKYRTVLAEKEITLEMDKETSYLVNGDALRIEQVLLNLFNNAIDHAELPKKIKISVKDAGEHVRLFVYNSGRPIPEESLEKIWTSFYKVDKARTREYGGHGLGLSIVRAIQELHGNDYGVENTQDGVIFWVDLDATKKA